MTTHNPSTHNTGPTLGVNAITCHAHGLCAELLPEMITLDEWGYPLLNPAPIPAGLLRTARQAAAACPTLALRLHQPS